MAERFGMSDRRLTECQALTISRTQGVSMQDDIELERLRTMGDTSEGTDGDVDADDEELGDTDEDDDSDDADDEDE